MRAVADNPELARASGIRARPVMVTLWLLIGICSASAASCSGCARVVVPEMGWNLLLPAFAAAVLGGVGNPVGAVLAGIGLGLVQSLSTPLVGFTYQTAIAFVLLIAMLVLASARSVRPRRGGPLASADGAISRPSARWAASTPCSRSG